MRRMQTIQGVPKRFMAGVVKTGNKKKKVEETGAESKGNDFTSGKFFSNLQV